jgi:hypothetical protein
MAKLLNLVALSAIVLLCLNGALAARELSQTVIETPEVSGFILQQCLQTIPLLRALPLATGNPGSRCSGSPSCGLCAGQDDDERRWHLYHRRQGWWARSSPAVIQ